MKHFMDLNVISMTHQTKYCMYSPFISFSVSFMLCWQISPMSHRLKLKPLLVNFFNFILVSFDRTKYCLCLVFIFISVN